MFLGWLSFHTVHSPDYEVGLTYGNMLGNRGLSGPLIVDTGDKAKFGPWTSPYIMKQSSRSMALHSSQEILENSASDGQNQQDRSHLTSDQRAESARCHGILHACANWMALHSTKMRIVLFKQGRWCTDDDLASKACYKDNLEVDKVTTCSASSITLHGCSHGPNAVVSGCHSRGSRRRKAAFG